MKMVFLRSMARFCGMYMMGTGESKAWKQNVGIKRIKNQRRGDTKRFRHIIRWSSWVE